MLALRKIVIPDLNISAYWWMSLKRCCGAVVPINELAEKKNYLFCQEQKRQLEEVGRIEKINVQVCGPPEDITLSMNQGISTPYDCCKHISQGFCQQTPLALVNDEILWDMHRPLNENCSIKFLNFKDKDPFALNKAFWRTGSFILGAVISKAFKDELKIYLHSFPPPLVKSGSFVYDVIMNLENWKPTMAELKVLSCEFLCFVQQNLKIERLKVKKSFALEIFEGNPYKQSQISKIADQAEDHKITLYKVGDHIDMSCGPMVGDTSFFGRCAVVAVHRIPNFTEDFYRFQAIALPKGIMLNSYAFSILFRRAERLNEANPPEVTDPRLYPYGTSNIVLPNSKIDVSPDPMI